MDSPMIAGSCLQDPGLILTSHERFQFWDSWGGQGTPNPANRLVPSIQGGVCGQ